MKKVIIVGRIEKIQEKKLVVNVMYSYKNNAGIYESNEITCKLWDNITTSQVEMLEVNCLIGIKGNLKSDNSGLYVKVDKLTFLATRKKKED